MRKRKRDWPQRVYRYAAVINDLPRTAWFTAWAQRELWNDLCALSALAAGEAKAAPERKKETWVLFERNARTLVERSGLGWELGPDVLDRFRAAMRGIGKNGKGPPNPQYGLLRHVRFVHRFTGGGMPVAGLRSSRASRCRVDHEARPGHGHQPFRFSVLNDIIEGQVVWHRPIPTDAIVKRVSLCGQRNVFGWSWSLHVTVEEPPLVGVVPGTLTAGFDLGWRGSTEPAGMTSGTRSRQMAA